MVDVNEISRPRARTGGRARTRSSSRAPRARSSATSCSSAAAIPRTRARSSSKYLREQTPVLLCVEEWTHWITVLRAEDRRFVVVDSTGRSAAVGADVAAAPQLVALPRRRLREGQAAGPLRPDGGDAAVSHDGQGRLLRRAREVPAPPREPPARAPLERVPRGSARDLQAAVGAHRRAAVDGRVPAPPPGAAARRASCTGTATSTATRSRACCATCGSCRRPTAS